MASIYVIGNRNVNPEVASLVATPEDRRIFRTLIRSLRGTDGNAASSGNLVLAVGMHFLGTPYAHNTLECGREQLVINLRHMDCFTFVENTVVLARLIREGKTAFSDFAAALKVVRYRGGKPDGYASRLHYFSDWLCDNEGKGWIRNITGIMGGEPFSTNINFMTEHIDAYPALNSAEAVARMRMVEQVCSRRTLYHIPKARTRSWTDTIKNGDVIAVTTDTAGLDVIHVGIAVRGKRDVHLLHASQRAGKVILSGETLHRYLAQRTARSGIMVGRVV